MILVIILVSVVYFLIAGVIGYLLGRAFGRVPLLILCALLALAAIAVLVLPMLGVNMEALLGGDIQGNRIFGVTILLPAFAGALALGSLGLKQRDWAARKG